MQATSRVSDTDQTLDMHCSNPFSCLMLLQGVFKDVYQLDAEGDVNRVIFASKQRLECAPQLDGTATSAVRACSKLVALTKVADAHAAPGSIPADDPLVTQLTRLRLLDHVHSSEQAA